MVLFPITLQLVEKHHTSRHNEKKPLKLLMLVSENMKGHFQQPLIFTLMLLLGLRKEGNKIKRGGGNFPLSPSHKNIRAWPHMSKLCHIYLENINILGGKVLQCILLHK